MMSKVSVLLASGVGAVVLSALLVVNLAFSDDGDDSKALFLQLEAQRDEAAARHAAELEAAGQGPAIVVPTLPASCPVDKLEYIGIEKWTGRGTPPHKMFASTTVTVIGAETYTGIWAGSVKTDKDQILGFLVVGSQFIDPCAHDGRSAAWKEESFLFDEKEGALTLTSANGNIVEFESESGKRGSINTDTGELTAPDDFQPLPEVTPEPVEIPTLVPAN